VEPAPALRLHHLPRRRSPLLQQPRPAVRRCRKDSRSRSTPRDPRRPTATKPLKLVTWMAIDPSGSLSALTSLALVFSDGVHNGEHKLVIAGLDGSKNVVQQTYNLGLGVPVQVLTDGLGGNLFFPEVVVIKSTSPPGGGVRAAKRRRLSLAAGQSEVSGDRTWGVVRLPHRSVRLARHDHRLSGQEGSEACWRAALIRSIANRQASSVRNCSM
jgi:hypothetical protein